MVGLRIKFFLSGLIRSLTKHQYFCTVLKNLDTFDPLEARCVLTIKQISNDYTKRNTTYVRNQLLQSDQPVVVSRSRGQVSRFGRHVRYGGYRGHNYGEKENGKFTSHRLENKIAVRR